MGLLSERDRARVEELKQLGVLGEAKPGALNHKEGIILICCSDGDCSHFLLTHHTKAQLCYRSEPRIHIFGLHGGALRIARNSPANQDGYRTDEMLIQEIRDAQALKGMSDVALHIHAPCGKAKLCGIDLNQSLALLFDAKDRIETEVDGMNVACFCHITHNDDAQTDDVFHVSQESWKVANELLVENISS